MTKSFPRHLKECTRVVTPIWAVVFISIGMLANKMPAEEIVAAGLISGLVLALVIAILRYLMGISGQTREDVLPCDFETVCRFSLAAFKLFPNHNIEEARPGLYKAVVVNNPAFANQSYALTTKSMGWVDWITITITPVDNVQTSVKIESTSDLNRAANIALDRRRHNVDAILEYLRRKCRQGEVLEQSESDSDSREGSSPFVGNEVWVADPWVVVLWGDEFHFQIISDETIRSDTLHRLKNGEKPREVFSAPSSKLTLSRVTAIERIAASNSVRWRAKWGVMRWLVIPDEADADRLFQAVARCLPGAGKPAAVRGGVIDIPISQYTYLIAGIFVVIFLGGLYVGALAGPERGEVGGIAKAFNLLTRLGESIGLIGSVIVTALVLGVIVAVLAWARRFSPMKLVVRANQDWEERG